MVMSTKKIWETMAMSKKNMVKTSKCKNLTNTV